MKAAVNTVVYTLAIRLEVKNVWRVTKNIYETKFGVNETTKENRQKVVVISLNTTTTN